MDKTTGFVTFDAKRASVKERLIYDQVRKAEVIYAQRLRGLSQRIVTMAYDALKSMGPVVDPAILINLAELLNKYGDVITPWAKIMAQKMVHDVALRDTRMWIERSKNIAWGIRQEIENAPIGDILKQRMEDQIGLITSIPREVASQVHQMAITSLYSGARADVLVKHILAMAETTKARANTIARTETSRTVLELTKARAEHIGSPGYLWRTSSDEDVRPSLFLSPKTFNKLNTRAKGSHRLLEGTFHKWSEPPISGPNGERSHPGGIYNCRCVAEVIVPHFPPDKLQAQSWQWSQRPKSHLNAW
jgi:uncharacterized protein with gpF-like domain